MWRVPTIWFPNEIIIIVKSERSADPRARIKSYAKAETSVWKGQCCFLGRRTQKNFLSQSAQASGIYEAISGADNELLS